MSEKIFKAIDELKIFYTGKIKMPFWLHESGLVKASRSRTYAEERNCENEVECLGP